MQLQEDACHVCQGTAVPGGAGGSGDAEPCTPAAGGCSGEQGAKLGPPIRSQQTALYQSLPFLVPLLPGELAMATWAVSSWSVALPLRSRRAGLTLHPALARYVSCVGDAVGEGPDPAEKQLWDMVGNSCFKTKSGPRPGQLGSHTNSYYGYDMRQEIQSDQVAVPLACLPPPWASGLAQEKFLTVVLSAFRRQPGWCPPGRGWEGEGKSDRLAKGALYLWQLMDVWETRLAKGSIRCSRCQLMVSSHVG